MKYPISDIFYSLQGEGHFVGYPMTFVRLAGCSVHECHIRAECDEAPWKARDRLSEDEIVARVVARVGLSGGVVCITGGEPTDHDLTPLVSALRDEDFRVHLETSGVRAVTGYPLEWLTVSPKVRGALQQKTGHTLKLVVRPEWLEPNTWEIINEIDENTQFFHRYLQPLTLNGVPTNLDQVAELLLSGRNVNGRWALSTQAHRIWGVR